MNWLTMPEGQILLAITLGQSAFMGAFVLVMVGLLLLPRRFFSEEGAPPAWWKNVRIWAAVICAVQIMVYWIWG